VNAALYKLMFDSAQRRLLLIVFFFIHFACFYLLS